jgi:PAS domain S-box-containing protein
VQSFFDLIRKGENAAVLLVSVLLVGLIVFLLREYYLTQMRLQEAHLAQLRHEMEITATSLSYFYLERKNDLDHLAAAGEVATFFENRALGMSMEYGLGASLLCISNRFKKLMEEKKLDNDAFYKRILLLDKHGKVLAGSSCLAEDHYARRDWSKFIDTSASHTEISFDRQETEGEVVVSLPYFFKKSYEGQVVAWISQETVYRHLVVPDDKPAERIVVIDCGREHHYLPKDLQSAPYISHLSDLDGLRAEGDYRFRGPDGHGAEIDVMAMRVPVERTSFSLVAFVPMAKVFGQTPPWHPILVMGLLSLFILGGTATVLAFSMRNMLLHTRLEEESKRKAEVDEKNLQLNREVEDRKRAEEEVKRHRDQLEALVAARTIELRKANEKLERDIAERISAEEALRESEGKYSALVEQAKDGVFFLQESVLKFVNSAMTTISGYEAEEILERPFSELLAPESREEFDEQFESLVANEKKPTVYESRIRCKDGTTKDVEVSAGIIKYRGKSASMGIVRDVTERKRMEEEVLKIQKLESIGTLAGGIAHDFNNILTAILGNISLAKTFAQSDDKILKGLNEAETASFRARDLTQQLLTFSKGGAPIRKNASVARLLRDTVTFTLSGSDIGCLFSLPDELWLAKIDEGQISQVINNLIVNAQEAMPKGGIIKIRAENCIVNARQNLPLKEGRYIKISIEDNGVGIPENYLPKIFDAYFTAKRTGNGLGLSISYSILKRHGGYINVESKEGVGTTFFIYLPASAEGDAVEATKVPEGLGIKTKVLVMDDEAIVRETALAMLDYFGCEAEGTADGLEAIELYKKARDSGRPFGVVILDLTVPGGVGGKNAIRRLQEIDPGVKAIVSSGYANDPVMANFAEYGFCGVVSKPYEVEKLRRALHNAVSDGIVDRHDSTANRETLVHDT